MSGFDADSRIGQNLFWILENDLRRNVNPVGDKNNNNLHYTLPGGEKFIPGTLEIFLSCLKLRSIDFVEDVSADGFIIVLDPQDRNRLNKPPQQEEPFSINYLKDPET